MNWKRIEPGKYVAGPYTIERVNGWWYSTGPSCEHSSARKDVLQDACHKAALDRIAGQETTCAAVVSDAVMLTGGAHGRVKAVMPCEGSAATDGKIYAIQFPRGRRTCVYRNEFVVRLP